eukprot:6207804-Pleurochrysis_carterae.AAC.2
MLSTVSAQRTFFERQLQSSMLDIAALEYDAVAAAAIHACEVAPRGPLPSDFGEKFIATKTNIAFNGLTGDVAFDANGDRENARVQLKNVIFNGDDFASPVLGRYERGEWTWNGGSLRESGILYNGGVGTAPQSQALPSEGGMSSTATIIASVLCVFALLIGACIIAGLVRHKRKKRKDKLLNRVCLERTLAPPVLSMLPEHKYHLFLSRV